MANNLTRYSPFGDLSDFQELFHRFPLAGSLASRQEEPRINIDVTETENAYQVKAEVPGASKDDVKVSIEDNVVSIRVEKSSESEQKEGETVLRRERYHGVQVRRFSLAQDIDAAQASAKCSDGVLELELPKKLSAANARVLDVQ